MLINYKKIYLIILVIGIHCLLLLGFSFSQLPKEKVKAVPVTLTIVPSTITINQKNVADSDVAENVKQKLVATPTPMPMVNKTVISPQPILSTAQNVLKQDKPIEKVQTVQKTITNITNNSSTIHETHETKELKEIKSQVINTNNTNNTNNANSVNTTSSSNTNTITNTNTNNSQSNQTAKIQGNCPKNIPYPQTAYRLQQEGTVKLKMLVTNEGKGEKVDILSSSGSSYLDDAAKQAFLKCKFQPAMINGVTQSGWVTKSYTFVLTESDE
jgi:TonB family protein